jgi:hypothetical protein
MARQREFFNTNGKCPLCDGPLVGQPCFIHEKAGRVHLFCSFKPERWRKWMQKVGLIPTPVDVTVIEDGKE